MSAIGLLEPLDELPDYDIFGILELGIELDRLTLAVPVTGRVTALVLVDSEMVSDIDDAIAQSSASSVPAVPDSRTLCRWVWLCCSSKSARTVSFLLPSKYSLTSVAKSCAVLTGTF